MRQKFRMESMTVALCRLLKTGFSRKLINRTQNKCLICIFFYGKSCEFMTEEDYKLKKK